MSENLGACCPGRVCGGLAGMFLRFEALCRALQGPAESSDDDHIMITDFEMLVGIFSSRPLCIRLARRRAWADSAGRFEALCSAGSLVIITFASGPSCVIEMLNGTTENNVENMGGTIERLVELLFLDVSFAKLQMQCTSVGLDEVWTECFRGGCSGPASTFCFHVVREANIYDMKVQRAIHPAEHYRISDVQCLPACSVCICRSWTHCTFIERPLSTRTPKRLALTALQTISSHRCVFVLP